MRASAGIVSLVLSTTLWGSSAAAQSDAERVLDALKAANAARTENAREAQEWAAERERLLLLKSTIEQQINQLTTEAQGLRAQADALQNEVASTGPERKRLSELETMADLLRRQIEDALDALAAETFIIRPKRVERPGADGFETANKNLIIAERSTDTITVEVVQGGLNGAQRTVELLRAGGYGGWWLSLDHSQGGPARRQSGQYILSETTDAFQLGQIRKAVLVAKGRAAPELIDLPYRAGKAPSK